jgi:hypothetical protein
MLDLSTFRSTPHPLNDFFKNHRITKTILARYLGLSPSWLAHLMLGYNPMPPQLEDRLQALAESVRRGEVLFGKGGR